MWLGLRKYCFLLKMGKIAASLHIDGTDPGEREKLVMVHIPKRNEGLSLIKDTYKKIIPPPFCIPNIYQQFSGYLSGFCKKQFENNNISVFLYLLLLWVR